VAVVLGSIETLPQIDLNFKLKSTSGQSNISVALCMLGILCDFVSQYSVVISPQGLFLTYFSSTAAFINIMQVVAFYPQKNAGGWMKCRWKVVAMPVLTCIVTVFAGH
jgi:uncharacterized protein with PQ loop repeat